MTLTEALHAPVRPNAEGLVVRYLESPKLVKIKQADYVALHKIVTGLNERVVWEQGYEGYGVLNELLGSLPDELYSWTRGVHDDLLARQSRIAHQAHREYAHIFESATDRKSFALLATSKIEDRLVLACVFSLLDGRDILPMIWKSLKPSGATRPFEQSEDVA
jgi:RNA ligase